MPQPIALRYGIGIVAAGGAIGAGIREIFLQIWPAPIDSFPWTVFAINVAGCALLAALPSFAVVRAKPWLPLFLGTGILGGFTTMSTAAVGAYDLRHQTFLAGAYLLGTLAAALAAVALVNRFTTADARAVVEAEEGDE